MVLFAIILNRQRLDCRADLPTGLAYCLPATVKGKGGRYKGGRRHLVRLGRCAKGGWRESLVRFAAAVKWIRVQGWVFMPAYLRVNIAPLCYANAVWGAPGLSVFI
ncbi:hypothetical protein CDAR_394081 [Caerostris darwini]|uniref:Uncharacterized protein n=1 Tax=Caerostris darwini TaxID=1538125 RepID=A0AAV4REC5_9ARAC|nr:hypothetical protein CDAR_394081 [Caerostris darwini]